MIRRLIKATALLYFDKFKELQSRCVLLMDYVMTGVRLDECTASTRQISI